MRQKIILIGWIIIWLILALCWLMATESTGDHGDSIYHYLFARYAHFHPDIFLDPWAKTGFTLIAWPFAQFGLKGIMMMNIFFVLVNMWLGYKVTEKLGVRYPVVAPIIMSLSTVYFTLIFSGLTEHAFSFVLLLSIYLLINNKWVIGTLVLSLLPFFRQEGYVIIASLLPFYLVNKKIKIIPLLASAFIIIGIIGAIRYNNMFWIISSNPYKTSNIYGSGSVFTFFNYLYYHHGLVNLIFFVLGICTLFVFPYKTLNFRKSKVILLVLLPYLAFFLSHVIFWFFGLYNSAGLQRVLNCIVPLFAIIASIGFSKLLSFLPNKLIQPAFLILLLLIIVFPLVPSPANINLKEDLSRAAFDSDMYKACKYINVNYKSRYIYFKHPLVPFYLHFDPFDKSICNELDEVNKNNLFKGSILIWESGLTKVHTGIDESAILSDHRLNILSDVTTIEDPHRIIIAEVK